MLTLHRATFRLGDFGRAVLFDQLAAAPGTLLDAAPPLLPPHGPTQQQISSRQNAAAAAAAPPGVKQVAEYDDSDHSVRLQPALYTLDGQITMTDPYLRPPEVIAAVFCVVLLLCKVVTLCSCWKGCLLSHAVGFFHHAALVLPFHCSQLR
jgi:hypothetical protein